VSTPAQDAAALLKERNTLGAVETAIILGERTSAGMQELVENAVSIRYADLPGFPRTPATEHGEAIICSIEGAPTLILKGRASFHETGDPSLMLAPIEALSLLGVRNVVATGFATSANADLNPSCIVAITDHIDFKGLNPLIGVPGDNFVNANDLYDKRLLRRLRHAASSAGVNIHEGVYAWFSGPSFETPAEVKAARTLGADIMGNSVAPEAIITRRFGMLFAGLVVVTDFGAGFSNGSPVADYGRGPVVAGLVGLKRLLRGFVKSK